MLRQLYIVLEMITVECFALVLVLGLVTGILYRLEYVMVLVTGMLYGFVIIIINHHSGSRSIRIRIRSVIWFGLVLGICLEIYEALKIDMQA